jgi:hypothetical protein
MLILAVWVVMSHVKASSVPIVTLKCLSVLFPPCGSRNLLFFLTLPIITYVLIMLKHTVFPQAPLFKSTASQAQSRSTDLEIQLPVQNESYIDKARTEKRKETRIYRKP